MKRITDGILKMSGQYPPQSIFEDWIKMLAIAISNQCWFNQELENQYIHLSNKYSSENIETMQEWLFILTELMENEFDDYLGKIYMDLGRSSNTLGQFFTPFHICEMMARIELEGYKGERKKLNEPSCGASGNIIGIAKVMKEKGYNYQDLLCVVAQDLDFRCIFMSYVQLSLYGINAVVIQGDTLAQACNLKLYTPMYMLKGGFT